MEEEREGEGREGGDNEICHSALIRPRRRGIIMQRGLTGHQRTRLEGRRRERQRGKGRVEEKEKS